MITLPVKFISGIHNYHKIGINGYIIRNRISDQEGMIRVVHNTGDGLESLIGPNGDFLFAPHNHRQDITLYRLQGQPYNVTLTYNNRRSGHGARRHVFNSELIDGKMGTHALDCGDLDVDQVRPITSSGIFMESQEIHTLIAPKGSAWLIIEGELATVKYPQHVNYCYSRVPGFKLETTPDLYQPMNPTYLEMQEFIFRFTQSIDRILEER